MKPNSLGGRGYQRKQKPFKSKDNRKMGIITVMDTTPRVWHGQHGRLLIGGKREYKTE